MMDEGGVIKVELLPPQPLMIAAETSTRKRAKDAIRFICASETPIGDETCTIQELLDSARY